MKDKGKFKIFIKYLTIELYHPYITWNTVNVGIHLNTLILIYRHNPEREWMMKWSFAFKILGFGFGITWKHCENPNSPNYFG